MRVQNTTFGAIKITPLNPRVQFNSKDLTEIADIARIGKTRLETGLQAGDVLSLNVMSKQGSLEEKEAMLLLQEYIGISERPLVAKSVSDKEALKSVEKIGK